MRVLIRRIAPFWLPSHEALETRLCIRHEGARHIQTQLKSEMETAH
jgi:hypothetical protein